MAKIAIDAGHGRYTSGKRCLKKLDPSETREWVLNARVADALGAYLTSAGHVIKRMDDTNGSTDISLANRVKNANNWGADFYISVHHNAGIGGGSGGGTEVYVSNATSSASVKAQNAIYKHAIARGNLKGNRSDGTRSANFYVVRYTKMPACLIECGFMDSAIDIRSILDPAWSRKIAFGIAEGICEVFGGKINSDIPAVSGGSYRVKVTSASLNIRAAAGAEHKKTGVINDKGIYTILQTVKTKDGGTWGKLKNGSGWINLYYTKKYS